MRPAEILRDSDGRERARPPVDDRSYDERNLDAYRRAVEAARAPNVGLRAVANTYPLVIGGDLG